MACKRRFNGGVKTAEQLAKRSLTMSADFPVRINFRYKKYSNALDLTLTIYTIAHVCMCSFASSGLVGLVGLVGIGGRPS